MNFLSTLTKDPNSIRNFNNNDLYEFSNWIKSKKKCLIKPPPKRKLTEYNKYMKKYLKEFRTNPQTKKIKISQQKLFREIANSWTEQQKVIHPCKADLVKSLKHTRCPNCDEYGNIVYNSQDLDDYEPPGLFPESEIDSEFDSDEEYEPPGLFPESEIDSEFDSDEEYKPPEFPESETESEFDGDS